MSGLRITDNGFIIITNNIIRNDVNKDKISLINTDKNIISVITYLSMKMNSNYETIFKLEELIKFLGYTPKTGKGKINDKIKDSLKWLQDKKIITCQQDLKQIKPKEYVLINTYFNKLLKKQDKDKKEQFTKIYYENFVKIFNSKYKNKIDLFNVYANLLSRKFPHEFNGNIKCEMCFPSIEQISDDVNISRPTLINILKELQELKLVFFDTIGDIKSDMNGFITANNVYVFKKEDLENALTLSRKHYYESGFFETKNRKQLSEEEKAEKNRRKVRKSRLKKRINEGKATQEEIEEYEQLCKFTNKNKINQQNNDNNNTKEEQIDTWGERCECIDIKDLL